MSKTPRSAAQTRQLILTAAETLARQLGPANIALDAVAAAAGVSKGGLLYHFPSKAKLLEGLVADHMERLDIALQQQQSSGRTNAVIQSFLQHFLDEQAQGTPPPTGLLAAFAENPDMLRPVREHSTVFLERIRSNASDPNLATLAYMAVQGLRSAELLGTPVLDRDAALDLVKWAQTYLADQADDTPADP